MIWARWAGVMGAPMKWEIARIFVVGTGGSGFCAEAASSGVIGFFMAASPYSSFGICSTHRHSKRDAPSPALAVLRGRHCRFRAPPDGLEIIKKLDLVGGP